MGRVVHFEIPTDDVARAKEFYGSIFGWQLQDMGEAMGGYTLALTTPVDQQTQVPSEPGAINGGLMKRSAETPSPVITVEVDAIDDALKQVESAGGTIVTPRSEIPGMGAYAYFKDPEGNVLGLWETH